MATKTKAEAEPVVGGASDGGPGVASDGGRGGE